MYWKKLMKPVLHNPLNTKSSNGTTNSQNRFMPRTVSSSYSNRFSDKKKYNNSATDTGNLNNNADFSTVQSFESVFSPLAETDLLAISSGKAMIRTNTNLDAFFAGLIVIGVITIGVANKTESIDENTRITYDIIGIVLLVLGLLLKKVFTSYSVFDNRHHKIYTEFFFFSKSFYKSKAISKNEILEIAVDHRKIEGNATNMANSMNSADGGNGERVESAIVFLLKNGTLSYFNAFTNWNGANEFYEHVAFSMSAVWGLAFKDSDINTKFIVKRLRGKPTLYPTDMNELNPDSIMSSMLRITIGLTVAIIIIPLIFWLVYKLA